MNTPDTIMIVLVIALLIAYFLQEVRQGRTEGIKYLLSCYDPSDPFHALTVAGALKCHPLGWICYKSWRMKAPGVSESIARREWDATRATNLKELENCKPVRSRPCGY